MLLDLIRITKNECTNRKWPTPAEGLPKHDLLTSCCLSISIWVAFRAVISESSCILGFLVPQKSRLKITSNTELLIPSRSLCFTAEILLATCTAPAKASEHLQNTDLGWSTADRAGCRWEGCHTKWEEECLEEIVELTPSTFPTNPIQPHLVNEMAYKCATWFL